MNPHTLTNLKLIGDQLDQNVFPNILDDGVVALNDSIHPSINVSEEVCSDVTQYSRRSATRSWEWTEAWKRKTSKIPSIIDASLKLNYQKQIDSIKSCYCDVKVWDQPEGMWLIANSKVLPGIYENAMFLIAIPYFYTSSIRGWGFWSSTLSLSWIGPRHTNFPDGSICAFEPKDNTWCHGDSLVELLDIYNLWALRHLYFKTFGRWPGTQSVQYLGERLLEMNSKECCGCGSVKVYKDCCQSADLSRNRLEDVMSFIRLNRFNLNRKPPTSIKNFAYSRKSPPSLLDLI